MPDLPDDAIVVRGGLMDDLEHLREQAQDDQGYLSIFVGTRQGTETFDAVVKRLCAAAPLPNRKIRISSVGRLRAVGCELEHVPPPPHCHFNVLLGTVTTERLEVFRAAFDVPMKNPVEGG